VNQQFGNDLDLTVGALPYPPGHPAAAPARHRPAPGPARLHENAAELADPAVVRSGQNLRHGLLLRNLTGHELQIGTNAQVTPALQGWLDRHRQGIAQVVSRLITASPEATRPRTVIRRGSSHVGRESVGRLVAAA
jgi:hypothetical protein